MYRHLSALSALLILAACGQSDAPEEAASTAPADAPNNVENRKTYPLVAMLWT